jgi:hypothetical protein
MVYLAIDMIEEQGNKGSIINLSEEDIELMELV